MSDKNALITFNELLYLNEKQFADMVYLRQPINGVWHEITWREAMLRARKMTAFLKGLGLEKGDRVAILSKNCAEWFMSDFAIAMGGFVSVPLFATHNPTTMRYVLEHSGAKVIFVGKLDHFQTLEPGIPDSLKRIAMPYLTLPANYQWNDVLAETQPNLENHVPNLDDLYSIIYTSGTTGNPKGVMIPFSSLTHAKKTFDDSGIFKEEPHNFVLSYLPLGHIFERIVLEYASLLSKTTVSFVESLPTFADNLKNVSPNLFIAVPRVWAQFQKGILEKLPQSRLDILLKIPILNSIVKKKIKAGLGLTRSRFNVSGSAPISASLLEWFKKVDIEIVEGYGRTEDLALATVGVRGKHRVGTVGKPWPGVEIKIDERGEILTRSKTMMTGYYNNFEATKKAFTEDGFLHTGDAGHFDDEGNLIIEGRLDDTFKTDKGEFVNPIPIEAQFAQNMNVEQQCLIGLTLPQPVLLVVLTDTAKNQPKQTVKKSLQSTLDSVNAGLTKFEKVGRIIIVDEAWTPENNLLTPTLKLKRQALHSKYISVAQANAQNQEQVVWA